MIEEVVTVAMPVSEKIVIRKNRIMSENLDTKTQMQAEYHLPIRVK